MLSVMMTFVVNWYKIKWKLNFKKNCKSKAKLNRSNGRIKSTQVQKEEARQQHKFCKTSSLIWRGRKSQKPSSRICQTKNRQIPRLEKNGQPQEAMNKEHKSLHTEVTKTGAGFKYMGNKTQVKIIKVIAVGADRHKQEVKPTSRGAKHGVQNKMKSV